MTTNKIHAAADVVYPYQSLAAEPEFIAGVESGETIKGLKLIAERIGYICGETTAQKARALVRQGQGAQPVAQPFINPVYEWQTPTVKDNTETSFEDAGRTGTLSSKSTRITTLDELLAFAKVDLDVWTCVRHVVNKWEVGAKDDKGRIVTEPLFQIKATLERRKGVEELRSITDRFIEKTEKFAPRYPKIVYPEINDGHLWELSIPDAHIGKLCWGRECGTDYDTKIARRVFMEAVKTLLSYAKGFPCSQILLPIGNDFLNADNATNTTTGGTPQDVDSRRAKIYEAGCDLLVEAIDLCSAIAPVHVVAVSGNHDYDSTVTICSYLRAWYRNNDNVTFSNEPTPRKYYRWGNSLIGFTHGNNEKMDTLPLIMATERADDWAKTKYRVWHLGHIHSEKQTRWKDIQEFNGVIVKHLPSLSGADFWHVLKGYSGLRAAKLFAWSLEDGCKGEFTHSPK